MKSLQYIGSLIAVAGSFAVSNATPSSAHSFDACMTDVFNFCGSDAACRTKGSRACITHGHPGGSVPAPPDPQNTFNSDTGWQLYQGSKLKAQ